MEQEHLMPFQEVTGYLIGSVALFLLIWTGKLKNV
jgi:hypothetical protein